MLRPRSLPRDRVRPRGVGKSGLPGRSRFRRRGEGLPVCWKGGLGTPRPQGALLRGPPRGREHTSTCRRHAPAAEGSLPGFCRPTAADVQERLCGLGVQAWRPHLQERAEAGAAGGGARGTPTTARGVAFWKPGASRPGRAPSVPGMPPSRAPSPFPQPPRSGRREEWGAGQGGLQPNFPPSAVGRAPRRLLRSVTGPR